MQEKRLTAAAACVTTATLVATPAATQVHVGAAADPTHPACRLGRDARLIRPQEIQKGTRREIAAGS